MVIVICIIITQACNICLHVGFGVYSDCLNGDQFGASHWKKVLNLVYWFLQALVAVIVFLADDALLDEILFVSYNHTS